MGDALRLIPSTVGTHHPEGPHATIVDIGGPDADGLAKYLLGLATPLQVLSPDPVRQALLHHARQLYEHNTCSEPQSGTMASERASRSSDQGSKLSN